MKEIIKNSTLKKEKGAITLYVTVACLFVMMIGIANYVLISNKQSAQIEQLRQIETAYTNGTTTQEIAKSYVGGDVIPIYTPQQMSQVGSGENVYVPQSGKVYTFTDDKTYVFYGQSEDLTSAIDNLVTAKLQQNIGLQAYPVGSIYISVNNTNPSEIFGGTWEEYGIGRTLVGVDTTQSEFDTIEETGGEKTHTLTTAEIPSHTHNYVKATGVGNHTLTIAEMPSHTHVLTRQQWYSADTELSSTIYGWRGSITGTTKQYKKASGSDLANTGGGGAHNHPLNTSTVASESAGSGSAHNNLQPYITVYMWKRTA